jgi:hypothetical protein
MPRGIAWDDLPTPYIRFSKTRNQPTAPVAKEFTVINSDDTALDAEISEIPKVLTSGEKLDLYIKNGKEIGSRAAFGLILGGITGLVFETVNAMRDIKGMSSRASIVTKQILRSSVYFGGFFAGYHALRKSLNMYDPMMTQETNIVISSFISSAPLAIVPKMRPMFPYGIVLIVLDAVSGGFNDGKQ